MSRFITNLSNCELYQFSDSERYWMSRPNYKKMNDLWMMEYEGAFEGLIQRFEVWFLTKSLNVLIFTVYFFYLLIIICLPINALCGCRLQDTDENVLLSLYYFSFIVNKNFLACNVFLHLCNYCWWNYIQSHVTICYSFF